eukprot:maker-scaffold_13-snap-gene-7.0-mRNA-1 protein AED:0.09 eAED:0.09 QI:59/0.5/0.33/1/1/1/3/0/338
MNEQNAYILTALIAIAVFLIIGYFTRSNLTKPPKNTVLLLGSKNSGKTVLFNKLLSNVFPDTVPSTEAAQHKITPEINPKILTQITLVDIPGSLGSGSYLADHLPTAGKVIFLVDSIDMSAKSIQNAAESLFNLFLCCISLKGSPKLLVAFSKCDLIDENEKSSQQEDIIKRLNEQLNILKESRSKQGDVAAEGEEFFYIGREGINFDLEVDSKLDISFCFFSAKGDDLEQITPAGLSNTSSLLSGTRISSLLSSVYSVPTSKSSYTLSSLRLLLTDSASVNSLSISYPVAVSNEFSFVTKSGLFLFLLGLKAFNIPCLKFLLSFSTSVESSFEYMKR